MSKMDRRRKMMVGSELLEFLKDLIEDKPLLPFAIPLVLIAWAFEKWILSISSWVPLLLAVWTTLQYSSHQRRILVEDLTKKWKRVAMNASPITPLEHCEWLNRLVTEIWPHSISPKLSGRFSSIIQKRLKLRKSKLIERIELLEFSLGSCPPSFGLQGARWETSKDLKIMRLGFDWDTNDISILLHAKLAKPFLGTARIVINSLHIKGDLVLMPVLNGKAVLYSFVSAPEVRIGVAFGSGGSQSLPATELPGVSSWLVKIITDTLVRTMVEPRRRCFSLPAVDLQKKAVGGIIYVTVVSATKLSRGSLRGSPSKRSDNVYDVSLDKDLQTFVEVEAEELTRRTKIRSGSSPKWDSTFNMVLHDEVGALRFNLYECTPNSVKYDYLATCEIKVKYVKDDSTIFWGIGPESGVIVKQADHCGMEVEMVVPFEGSTSGELTVKLVLKEWQFSDGSHSMNNYHLSLRKSLYGSSNFPSRTGRKIVVSVMEGKDLSMRDRSGKSGPYVKLQYGKAIQRTRTAPASSPTWNQRFEFEELGGDEYLMIKCYSEETFGDDNIGSARVNLEGLFEDSLRDVWIPLEKVNSGELRLQIEAVRPESRSGPTGDGLIELAVIEARDLIAADFRGTSDPYVRVQYGNSKRRTKVISRTLNPKWNQTFEFGDDGSPLTLHVKDHNAVLPTSSIGDCVVEYHRLPPNELSEKWIPLQGVKRGEVRIQIIRKVPDLLKASGPESEPSVSKAHEICGQMKELVMRCQSVLEEGNVEGVSGMLSELQSLEDLQEEYMVQLETEQSLLVNKIKLLGDEIFNSSDNSPSLTRGGSSQI